MRETFKKGDWVLYDGRIYRVLEDEDGVHVKIDHEDDHTDHFVVHWTTLTRIQSCPWREVLERATEPAVLAMRRTEPAEPAPHMQTLKVMHDAHQDAAKETADAVKEMDDIRDKNKDKGLSFGVDPEYRKAEQRFIYSSRRLNVAREAHHNAIMAAISERLLEGGKI